MLEYVLDTNICIYVIKNRPAALRERFDQLAATLCISTIILYELLYGVEKSARRSQNRSGRRTVRGEAGGVAVSAKAAGHFGQIRAEFARVGWPCGGGSARNRSSCCEGDESSDPTADTRSLPSSSRSRRGSSARKSADRCRVRLGSHVAGSEDITDNARGGTAQKLQLTALINCKQRVAGCRLKETVAAP
jgi:tRNA(fMet)-specific endonuclease VapC